MPFGVVLRSLGLLFARPIAADLLRDLFENRDIGSNASSASQAWDLKPAAAVMGARQNGDHYALAEPT